MLSLIVVDVGPRIRLPRWWHTCAPLEHCEALAARRTSLKVPRRACPAPAPSRSTRDSTAAPLPRLWRRQDGRQDGRARATRSGHRGALQVGEVDPLQASGVGCRQHHRRRHPGPVRLRPPARAKTPAIARAQPREAELRTRRLKVIADPRAEPQELGGHHRTDRVHPGVIGVGVAAAVAMEPCHRVGAAALQLATQHIARHVSMVT